MAELADAFDLGSNGVICRGSSPLIANSKISYFLFIKNMSCSLIGKMFALHAIVTGSSPVYSTECHKFSIIYYFVL